MTPDLERAWARSRYEAMPQNIGICAVLAMISFAAFGLIDPLVMQDPSTLMALRGGRVLVIGMLALVLALARLGPDSRLCQVSGLLCAAVIGVSVSIITVVVGGGTSRYHDALAVTIFAYGAFIPSTFSQALGISTFLIAFDQGLMMATGTLGVPSVAWTNFAILLMTQSLSCACVFNVNKYRMRELQVSMERIAMIAQLQQLDSAKNAFFANVSHELRTPIMVILATLEGLQEGLERTDPKSQSYGICRRNSFRLLRLVDDVLELSRLESSTTKLRVSQVDVARMVADLVEQMSPIAARKSVALRYVGCASAVVTADPSAVERVVNNLISNALKFTPAEQSVVVDVRDADPVSLSVQDTGVGMSEDDRSHAFDRFYQGKSGKKIKVGGIGIGLSMCKRIVEMHSGNIAIQSQVGIGTTVAVQWFKHPSFADGLVEPSSKAWAPTTATHSGLLEWDQGIRQTPEYRLMAAQEASERRLAPRDSDESSKKTSVLVVEDNRDLIDLLSSALAGEHRVYVATDGAEGLSLARRFRPDVIVSDVSMPIMDGFAFVARVRKDPQIQDTPVVLMTAGAQSNTHEKSDQVGADAYLTKPFTHAHLRAIIHRFVGRQQALATQMTEANTLTSRIAAAGLAHDILNPIGFIKSAAFVFEKSQRILCDENASVAERDKAAKHMLSAIKSTNAGIERVVESVEMLRQMSSGETSIRPELCDVNIIVQRTLAVTSVSTAVKTTLEAKNKVSLHRGQLERVILNLVLNAMEAGGNQCHIGIETSDAPDNQVRIVVRDNGPGMDGTTVARAMDPFFSTKKRGSGLGLAMCRQIIEQHGGHFSLQSSLGLGTEFYIDLPSAPASQDLSLMPGRALSDA